MSWSGGDVERTVEKQNNTDTWSRGSTNARHNLGVTELHRGNMNISVKHFMITVGFGGNESLHGIQQMYSYGHATKDKCQSFKI